MSHLPIAWSLSVSCSEPSAETIVPVLEPHLECLVVFLRFETQSDCHRGLQFPTCTSPVSLALLQQCDGISGRLSVAQLRVFGRRCSGPQWVSAGTTSQHPAARAHRGKKQHQRSTAPREAGVGAAPFRWKNLREKEATHVHNQTHTHRKKAQTDPSRSSPSRAAQKNTERNGRIMCRK